MNIFVTDPCPVVCAKALDNKRLVKMVLETAQLLCTAINISGGVAPYKETHKNHPCSIWARESRGNYLWLVNHFNALCSEYTARYGKTHKCQEFKDLFEREGGRIWEGDQTPFPNCTIFKDISDVHLAYRTYMNHKWENDKNPSWGALGRPVWG